MAKLLALAAAVLLLVPVALIVFLLLIVSGPASAGLGDCPENPDVFPEGHMQPNAIALGRCIAQSFPELQIIGGWRPSDPYPDHPSGQALDVMLPGDCSGSDFALGVQIAEFAAQNAEEARVVYVLFGHRTWSYAVRDESPELPWEQWRQASERGSCNENHMNHIHIATDGPEPLGGQASVPETDWQGRGFQGAPPTQGFGSMPDTGGEGQWIFPIKDGAIGSTAGWRFHPILKYTRCHAGADIGASYGAPIYSPAAGTVKSVAWNGGYGNYTVISHGGGVTSQYAHQSSTSVKAGQAVLPGQVIGRVGSTGLSSGPHLHFEIFVDGKPYDPKGWVTKDSSLRKPVCV